MPERFEKLGDLGSGIDASVGSLEPLLDLVKRHEAEGLEDAPWPPHYRKQSGEPRRVQPSKRKEMPLVTVSKAAKKGKTHSKDSSGGRSATPRPRPSSKSRTFSSTRCVVATRPGPASASISETCQRTSGRPKSRPTPTTIRGRSGDRAPSTYNARVSESETRPQPRMNDIASRLEFEQLIAEISSRFIHLAPDEVDSRDL